MLINGGFGEHITRFYNVQGVPLRSYHCDPDAYVEHGNVDI